MSEIKGEESVEVASFGQGRLKQDQNTAYIRSLKKNTNATRYCGITFGILGIFLTCFRNTQPQAILNIRETIGIPMMESEQIDPTKMYNRAADAKDSGSKNKKLIQIKLTGPKLLTRSTKLKIPPGSEVLAELINGASNGLVKAKLKNDVIVAGELFLGSGTILIGQGSSTEERLFIRFNKSVLEDGSVSQIQAEVADMSDKTMGLKGSKVSSRAVKMAASAGLNFLAGVSEVLQDTQGEQGAVVPRPTLKNAMLHGTAKAAIEQANEIASEYKNMPPILAVKAGTEILVIFTDDGG